MKLTKQTDFAFRTLIFLVEHPDKLVTIREVCDYFDMSTNHVAKVVVKLVQLSYVDSVRGHGGGMRLAKPASEISLASVVLAFETDMKAIDCAAQPCVIIDSCKLKGILAGAMNAFVEHLQPYSLADIASGDVQAITLASDTVEIIASENAT